MKKEEERREREKNQEQGYVEQQLSGHQLRKRRRGEGGKGGRGKGKGGKGGRGKGEKGKRGKGGRKEINIFLIDYYFSDRRFCTLLNEVLIGAS